VLNAYGTLTSPVYVGAAQTPNICCNTLSLQSYTNVFIGSGLSPTIVPSAPLNGITSVVLNATVPITIGLDDDYSYSSGLLASQALTINLVTATTAANFYHVLMFDSTTNKDCWFVANNPGSGTTALTVAALAATNGAGVFNTGTASVPVYNYTSTYKPPQAAVSQRWVVLVWGTTNKLNFAPPGSPITTTPIMINNNPGQNGDFEPSRLAGASGQFTTVSALLAGKLSTILGTATWGTYFYLTT